MTRCELPYPGNFSRSLERTSSQILKKSEQKITELASSIFKVVNTDVKGGAYNRAAFEQYKAFLRMQMEKPIVFDAKLNKIFNYNYREGAIYGNGSTAAAIRHEKLTGEQIFGSFHSQKGRDLINSYVTWMKNNPTAKPTDIVAAENAIKDIINALHH